MKRSPPAAASSSQILVSGGKLDAATEKRSFAPSFAQSKASNMTPPCQAARPLIYWCEGTLQAGGGPRRPLRRWQGFFVGKL